MPTTTTIKQALKSLLPGLLLACILLGAAAFAYTKSNREPIAVPAKDNALPVATTLTLWPKAAASDPDLKLTQTYRATVNGKNIEVPLTNTDNAPDMLQNGHTAVLNQTVDLTPIIKKLVPKWSVGVGLGITEGKAYVPVAVERIYKEKQAVQISIHLGLKEKAVRGGEITHKWYF